MPQILVNFVSKVNLQSNSSLEDYNHRNGSLVLCYATSNVRVSGTATFPTCQDGNSNTATSALRH